LKAPRGEGAEGFKGTDWVSRKRKVTKEMKRDRKDKK
jgi:hypothetical protein